MMSAPLYIAFNSFVAESTWAQPVSVTTGTALKTMLQIKPGSSKIRIVEWGYSFDVVPTAVVKVDLCDTGTVAATVTAFNAADIVKYNDVTGAASLATVGTTASGFGSSGAGGGEGSLASLRVLAFREEWGQSFVQQYPLGREPEITGANFLRIRANTATALNMSCYVIWEE
jgi:hypothetical protein